jgi:hypothetical protein
MVGCGFISRRVCVFLPSRMARTIGAVNRIGLSFIALIYAASCSILSSYDADTLIAVRGQDFDYGDGDIVETVYTVSACPNQDDTSGYCWTYVRAGDWMAEFDDIQHEAA